MADMGMFGSPIGQHHAESDMARNAMTTAQLSKAITAMDIAPFQMAQKAAQSQYLGQRAQALQREQMIERQVAAMVQNGWNEADAYVEAGDVSKALKAEATVAQIEGRVATAETQRARGGLIEARRRLAVIDELSREARTIDSPEALQTFAQQYAHTHPSIAAMLTPEGALKPDVAPHWEAIRNGIQQRAVSETARVQTDVRERALTSATAARERRGKHWDFLENVDRQRAMADARRRPLVAKAGGDPLLLKPDDVKYGSEYVSSNFPDIDPNRAKILGRELASAAKQMRMNNPALSVSDSMKEAFRTIERRGDFAGMTRKPFGAAPERAKPLPAGSTGKLDTSKLTVGEYYREDGGGVAQWLGPEKGFGPPSNRGKIKPAATTAVDNTEAEDDALALEDDDEEE